MIVIRRTSFIRFLSSKWTLIAAAGIGMLIFIGCEATPGPDDQHISTSSNCTCDGTTLHCTEQNGNPAADVPNSKYCDITSVTANGNCSCSGTTLSCLIGACTYQNAGCMALGGTATIAVCDPETSTNSSLPGVPGDPLGSGVGTVNFPNSASCAAGGQPPPPPPPSGGTSGGGVGCACAGVDYICKNADGSVKSTSYNAAECGGSATCNCRGGTLVCPDGTYAEFNPQCTGSTDGGNPTGLCGNGLCDVDEPVTCPSDCPKP